jgi:hypothetical protein
MASGSHYPNELSLQNQEGIIKSNIRMILYTKIIQIELTTAAA